jgi:hypothetical protein
MRLYDHYCTFVLASQSMARIVQRGHSPALPPIFFNSATASSESQVVTSDQVIRTSLDANQPPRSRDSLPRRRNGSLVVAFCLRGEDRDIFWRGVFSGRHGTTIKSRLSPSLRPRGPGLFGASRLRCCNDCDRSQEHGGGVSAACRALL